MPDNFASGNIHRHQSDLHYHLRLCGHFFVISLQLKRLAETGMNLLTAALVAELAVLFVGLPLLIRLLPVRISPLPVLWMAAVYALFMLRRTPGFDPGRLWNAGALKYSLGSVLELFAVGAVIVTIV